MDLLLLTADRDIDTVLPALALLGHRVRAAPPEVSALLNAGPYDALLVDARQDLAAARSLCRLLESVGTNAPVIAVFTEGGLVAVSTEWAVDEILLTGTTPAEVDARLRLLAGRQPSARDATVALGDLTIDEVTYTTRLRGRPLDLTYKEFELLKYMAQQPGRVFTRVQLLQEVWGYDFFGGARTVDVHVRRLRAKLGPEHEGMIGTVRNVGYKLVHPARGASAREQARVEEEDDEVHQPNDWDGADGSEVQARHG